MGNVLDSDIRSRSIETTSDKRNEHTMPTRALKPISSMHRQVDRLHNAADSGNGIAPTSDHAPPASGETAPPPAAVAGDRPAGDDDGAAARPAWIDPNDVANPRKKKKENNGRGRRHAVPLFALFDASPLSSTGGGDTNGDGGEGGGQRPRRKLKAVRRFDSLTPSDFSYGRCRTGYGFACPRCPAVCSYDSRRCHECSLDCCYEAGVGVVVLKDRRITADNVRKGKREERTRGEVATSTTVNMAEEIENEAISVDRNAATMSEENGPAAGISTEMMVANNNLIDEFNAEVVGMFETLAYDDNGSERASDNTTVTKRDDDESTNNGDAIKLSDCDQRNKGPSVAELNEKLDVLSKSNLELKRQVSMLQGNHEEVVNRLRAKEAAMEELDTKFGAVDRKAKAATAELSMLREEASKGSSEMTNLKAEITKAKAERDTAEARAKDLATANTSAKNAITAERNDLASKLEDAQAKLKSTEAEKESAIASAQSAAAAKDKVVQNMAVFETEHNSKFAQLNTEIESLKQRILEATTEKTNLVTRIASALEGDVAGILREKDEALREARSTIATLKMGALSPTATKDFTSNIRKVSLSETKQPSVATMEREEEEASSTTLSSPKKQDSSGGICPKSAMVKHRDSSLSLGSKGRVSFDSTTSFDQATNRVRRFDLFSSPVHNKENFLVRKKSAPKSSSSGSSGGSGDISSSSSSSSPSSPSKFTFQQASGTSSYEGSLPGGARRRKKPGKSRSSSFSGVFENGLVDDASASFLSRPKLF